MGKSRILNPALPFQRNSIQDRSTRDVVELYTDGASRGNPGPAGIGIVIRYDHHTLERKQFIGITTNNTAEYQALIHGLEFLKQRNLRRPLRIYSDSQLMVRQLKGEYKIKQPHLQALARKVHFLLRFFPSHEIIHITRDKNRHADRLANEALNERARK